MCMFNKPPRPPSIQSLQRTNGSWPGASSKLWLPISVIKSTRTGSVPIPGTEMAYKGDNQCPLARCRCLLATARDHAGHQSVCSQAGHAHTSKPKTVERCVACRGPTKVSQILGRETLPNPNSWPSPFGSAHDVGWYPCGRR